MLSPKYAKMFLAEAEQLAKKYKLKPPTHVNSTKGAYSNSLDSSLSKNTNTLYELPPAIKKPDLTSRVDGGYGMSHQDTDFGFERLNALQKEVDDTVLSTEADLNTLSNMFEKRNIMPVPIGGSGHDVVVLPDKPMLSGALANPIPSTVADITSAITAGSEKGLEQARGNWKKWIKGVGLAAAVSSGSVAGLHSFDNSLANELSKKINITSNFKPRIDKQQTSTTYDQELLGINNPSDKTGAFVNAFGKGHFTDVIEGGGVDVKGYNIITGHGNAVVGNMRLGYTKAEAAEAIKSGLDPNAVEGKAIFAKEMAAMLRADKNYDPNLPTMILSCNLGKRSLTTAQELSNELGAPVIAFDGSAVIGRKILYIADNKKLDKTTNTYTISNKNSKIQKYYPQNKKTDIKIPYEELRTQEKQLKNRYESIRNQTLFKRLYDTYNMNNEDLYKPANKGLE